jgi:RNA polymerase sigma-70 factor (ECF subfamily)
MFEDTDATLVARARTGDFAAFEALVRQYRNEVYALAYHFVRNREDAWDVSQEVFIKAYRSLGSFRGEASFKTWLMRITANQCKDILKKRRVETVEYNDALETHELGSAHGRGRDPAWSAEAKETGTAILKALDSLSVKHRTAFVLRELHGLSYEEMAQVMGCSLGTVMSRLHHARKRMQASLQKMGFPG